MSVVPGDVSGSASEIRAITPSDATELVGCRGIFHTGSAADIAVKSLGGDAATTAVTVSAVPAGFILPLYVTHVMSTNTTATQIYGLFG